MQEFEIELTQEELELLGTDNPAEIERALGMLAEVWLSEIAIDPVFGEPNIEVR